MSNFENIDEDLLKKLQKYDISLNEALQTGISQIVDAQEYDRIPNKIPRKF